MLQTRKIYEDENGAYVGVFGQGDANIITGGDALAQILKHQLLTVKGELKDNTDFGVSWFNHDIRNEQILKDAQIKRIINQNQYVKQLKSFISEIDENGNYVANIEVLTSEGLLTLTL